MSIGRFSVNNPVLINLISITILVVGTYTYITLPREILPEIPFNWAFVTTVYAGAGPEEVELLVTKPIEDAIEDIDKIDLITSTSGEGISVISVKFEQGLGEREFEKRFQELRTRVGRSELPSEAEEPEVLEWKTSTYMPMLSIVVSGTLSEHQLRSVADELEVALESIPGIADITLAGAREREIWIEVDENTPGTSEHRALPSRGRPGCPQRERSRWQHSDGQRRVPAAYCRTDQST